MIKKTKAVKAATTKIKRIAPETILGTVNSARLANCPPGERLISSAAKTAAGSIVLILLINFLMFFHLLSIINNLIIIF